MLSCVFLFSSLQTFSQIPKFLTNKQKKDFYTKLFSEIELLDAEARETRNNSKKVKWNKFKKHYRKKFDKAKNWKELEDVFNRFGKGFVNLHSSFNFYSKTNEKREIERNNIRLGFEYPQINFFELKSKKDITHINNVPIKKVFDYYENYECNFNSTVGCLSNFVSNFRRGMINANGVRVNSIRLADGKESKVEYKIAKNIQPFKPIYYYDNFDKDFADWEVIKKGHLVAVLRKDNVALVRIFSFRYGKEPKDFRCKEKAEEKTICGDVQIIRESLNSISDKTDYLILDVQNNTGGNENTAFIAQLAQKPFYDMRVLYRKTPILEDEKLRRTLFYFSNKGEKWFQNLKKNGTYKNTKNGEFLPVRADFCQGDKACELKPVEPNKSAVKFKKVLLLTNQMCISSCDDFAWRMKDYADAELIGQPHAADATYSRIEIVFYLDKKGKIARKYVGEREKFEVDGELIAKIKIPYSKMIDAKGKLLQGKPAKFSHFVPITKENYSNIENVVRIKALKYLEEKKTAKL